MRCPVCGADVPEGEKFCPGCGVDITSMQPAEVAQAPQEVAQQPAQQPAPVGVAPPPPPAAPSVAGLARLLLKRGGVLTGEEFPIGGRVVIGRFHEETGPVDVDLSHLPEGGYVSRHHAEIYQDASGQWFVKDLSSTNGTYLRSSETGQFQRLPANQPTPINDGDEVVFGNAHFIFRTQG
jgi:hypothetical protein